MIKAVIFDMDGVLVDSEPLYWKAERQMAEEYGKEIGDEILYQMMGATPEDSFRVFKEKLNVDTPIPQLVKKRNELYIEIMMRELEPLPGLHKMLDELDNIKIATACATGAPGKLLELQLKKVGVFERFPVKICSDEIKEGKPNPEIFNKAIKKLGFKSNECAVVEDSIRGLIAARRSGAFTIAFPNHIPKSVALPDYDYLIQSLSQLPKIIINHVTG